LLAVSEALALDRRSALFHPLGHDLAGKMSWAVDP
jgi:hypothetical protein